MSLNTEDRSWFETQLFNFQNLCSVLQSQVLKLVYENSELKMKIQEQEKKIRDLETLVVKLNDDKRPREIERLEFNE